MKELRQCFIIDDDQDDQEIFLMCVSDINPNIDCRTASNGAEAVEMLESQKDYAPDYIFLDVNMPKMNGIECLGHLKKMDWLRNTKIFIYSTTSEKSVVEESKALGADDFIVKPTKMSVLKEALSGIFN
jgi:CheY-like chemotaxis protein